ncbi:protein of unknown function [Vibrio tapetis subsp. tapetis]|uniref:Uncharacterized protein n=1 Tax=Vibrio tapetis subsp. tapetis TaxID=1671868 RepID=A0A2N8Z7X2_9VIBR|nr:protein of unknown function [Vibrio tapetis subsp. tapetis]
MIGIFNEQLIESVSLTQTCSLLVQLVERRTVNPYVAGSSPAKGATFKKTKSKDLVFFRL